MFRVSTMNNGVRILTQSMAHLRSATVGVYVKAGSRLETDPIAGMCHVVEHMLFKGCAGYETPVEIATAIESLGGVSNAMTDREMTVYYARVPADGINTAVDVLGNMLLRPTMRAGDLEKEQDVIVEEIAMVEDVPSDLCDQLVDEAFFADHALGRSVAGSVQTVRAMTQQAVADYHATHYVGPSIVVVGSGQIDHDNFVALCERTFGNAPSTAQPVDLTGAPSLTDSARVALRTRDTEQVACCISLAASGYDHDACYREEVLNTILGDGMSSRLFVSLREEHALVYDIGSYISRYRDTGTLTVSFGCDEKRFKKALSLVKDVLTQATVDVTADELHKAKRMVNGQLSLRMEDTAAVSGWIGSQLVLKDNIELLEDYLKAIENVTRDQVIEAARQRLDQNRCAVAAVGPLDTIPW